jgi:hypothetical protein
MSLLAQELREIKAGMVIHVYNPCYLGGEDRRVVVQGQPSEKVSKTLSQK